jgi:hypothetical protein
MLGIEELLSARGLDTAARIKLVRHQDKRYDVAELERKGLLELYQSYQAKPVFECDYIVSFIGLEKARARLFGVYRVAGRCAAIERPLPEAFEYPAFLPAEGVFYHLEKLPGFEALERRVVIGWGDSALAWHQWLTNKEVIEILPAGYVQAFPGYLDFVISYPDLVEIINNPSANREWHRMLAAVAGVYLIVDAKSGRQYVGSAYGQQGILGRWKAYASSGHGGNKQLAELLDIEPECLHTFQFTILRTLPRTLTHAEVIAYEVLYKRKLGSRAFGLNSN